LVGILKNVYKTVYNKTTVNNYDMEIFVYGCNLMLCTSMYIYNMGLPTG